MLIITTYFPVKSVKFHCPRSEDYWFVQTANLNLDSEHKMCGVFQPLLKYSQKVWDNRTGGGRKLLTIFPLDQEISKAVSFAPHPPPPIYLLPACLPLLSGNTHHGPDLVDNKVSKHTSCAAHLMSGGVWRVRNKSQEERVESGKLVLDCIPLYHNGF